MGAKYSTQATSGYNATPPADDGSQVAANLITWAGIKSKIGDVLKTFGEAINTALVSAFDYSVRQITTNDTTVAGDHMRCVEIAPTVTTAVTISLGDAATMTNVYRVFIKNSSARNQTLTRITGGDTLDGVASSVVLAPGEGRTVQTNNAANGYVTVSRYGPFTDGDAVVAGGTDGTKKVRLEVDGLTTSTTRVITVPDRDFTLDQGLYLLSTATASNSSSLDFTSVMDSTLYSGYVAQLLDILPATNAALLSIRLSTNNGSSYDAGTNYIAGNANYQANTATPSWNLAGTATGTGIPISIALSNSVARCIGNAWIYTGAGFAQVIANTTAIANDAASKFFQQSTGDWNGGGVANAVRFLMSSGNITSGSIRLYGIRK